MSRDGVKTEEPRRSRDDRSGGPLAGPGKPDRVREHGVGLSFFHRGREEWRRPLDVQALLGSHALDFSYALRDLTARGACHAGERRGTSSRAELARAALDRAGAYSRELQPASTAEVRAVAEKFGALGHYEVAKLGGQEAPGCPTCGWCAHLFSNWFYGVAWDWCYVVLWREARTAAIVCMTDTD